MTIHPPLAQPPEGLCSTARGEPSCLGAGVSAPLHYDTRYLRARIYLSATAVCAVLNGLGLSVNNYYIIVLLACCSSP